MSDTPTTPERKDLERAAQLLLEIVERWHDKLDGSERDDLARVRNVLFEIADGDR